MPDIKHYIIVKFKENVDKNSLIQPIKNIFNETLKIDGVKNVDVKVSNSTLANRYDIMIEMHLTKEGLYNYDNSALHKKWKNEYGNYIMNKTIFDCDL